MLGQRIWAKRGFLVLSCCQTVYGPLQRIPWAGFGCRQCLSPGLQRPDRRMRPQRQSPCRATSKYSQHHNSVDKHPFALSILSAISCLWGGLQNKRVAQYRKEMVCSLPSSQWKMPADKHKIEAGLSTNHWEEIF